jgi:hypothetical protein
MKKALSLTLALVMVFGLFAAAPLTASAKGDLIGEDPKSKTINEGDDVTFDVVVYDDVANASFQWYADDGSGWAPVPATVPYSSGGTDWYLSLKKVPASFDGYQYRCKVSGTKSGKHMEEYSEAATLTVISAVKTAGPGPDRASAPELKAGQSDTYTWSGTGNGWYKIELTTASKVVITLSIENGISNDSAGISIKHGINGYNDMVGKYVGPTGGSLADRVYSCNLDISVNDNRLSTTGTWFLAEGWCYIDVYHYLHTENLGPLAKITVKIDSIEPIADTGGLTRETATAVKPKGETVSQYRYDHERDSDVGYHYYKFTLPEAASVSIQLSVRLEPGAAEYDNRVNSKVSFILGYPDNQVSTIRGMVDGEEDWKLTIMELDAILTKTMTYTLPAGTYIVELDNSWAYRGTECTLKFSMSGAPVNPTQPEGASNLDSADGWAREAITSAIAKGFVPSDIQGRYTSVITRAEFCRLAVKWMEYVLGASIDEILAQRADTLRDGAFSDTDDPAILAAFKLGIISGTTMPTAGSPGVFTPNGDFSRQMAATLIMNACKAVGADVSNPPVSDFIDLNTAESWARDGINFCRANGIMGGTSTTTPTFSPNDTYTRQQGIMTFDNIDHDALPGRG